MKIYKTKTWQHITTGKEGNTTIFGVNIFDYEWNATGERVAVKDPLYGQDYLFPVYKVIINNIEYEFACGEFSNCVWGFYEYKY